MAWAAYYLDILPFQSPMGIVSSAKHNSACGNPRAVRVSIPDGDSFLREGGLFMCHQAKMTRVSIPDGDSFLREVFELGSELGTLDPGFNPRWG